MKKILLLLLPITVIGLVCLAPVSTLAADPYNACQYNPDAAACADKDTKGAQTNLATRVQTVLDTVYLTAGILAIIFIVYAGIRYVTATGQADKVKLAQKQLTYAIVGLIVAVVAFGITRFVVYWVTR
ncbi:pilin [Candidatus Saccharibacteria bacterium]|nr:pilin [Candidatus Saccharibacteria bacterium]